MARGFGAHERRVIDALAAGRRFRRRADGGWIAGTLIAPASLVAALTARGAIAIDGDRLVAGAAAPAAAPARLLVERTIADDAEATPAGGRRPAARRSVTVNLAESPLGWLRARGLVDARQFEAGERLRSDWTVAGLGPRVTMRWEAGPRGARRGDAADPTIAQIAAKQRTDAALEAAGPGLKDVLWRIVCAGEGMETAERALGWPARAGRVVLTLALDRLADHYRLP